MCNSCYWRLCSQVQIVHSDRVRRAARREPPQDRWWFALSPACSLLLSMPPPVAPPLISCCLFTRFLFPRAFNRLRSTAILQNHSLFLGHAVSDAKDVDGRCSCQAFRGQFRHLAEDPMVMRRGSWSDLPVPGQRVQAVQHLGLVSRIARVGAYQPSDNGGRAGAHGHTCLRLMWMALAHESTLDNNRRGDWHVSRAYLAHARACLLLCQAVFPRFLLHTIVCMTACRM